MSPPGGKTSFTAQGVDLLLGLLEVAISRGNGVFSPLFEPVTLFLKVLPVGFKRTAERVDRVDAAVAAQHYLTVRESDFEAAVAPQPVVDSNTRLQNALQQAAEMPRMGSQTPQVKKDERPAVQAFTTECELVRTSGMPPEGLEPSTR